MAQVRAHVTGHSSQTPQRTPQPFRIQYMRLFHGQYMLVCKTMGSPGLGLVTECVVGFSNFQG